MKKIILISVAIFLLFLSGYFLFGRKINIKNAPPKNDTIVVFGDSLAQGVGATEGNDISSLIAEKTGKVVLNYGRSGDTTQDAVDRVPHALSEKSGIVMIILGGNDVLKKIPKDDTFHNLETMIKLFQENGSAVILVGVRSGVVGDGRGDDYQSLAQKTGSLYVSDILQDVFGKRQYMSDAVHPNNAGYEIIVKRVAPIVMKLY